MAQNSDKGERPHYCRSVIDAMTLARPYVEPVVAIIEREHGGRHPEFGDAVAVNTDAMATAEASQQGRSEHRSVDMAVGLAAGRKETLCLVEAKYAVRNVMNINRKEIDEKVRCTKAMLISRGTTAIREGVVLLVDRELERKRRLLDRRLGGDPYNKILTTGEFYNKYFAENKQ